MGETFLRRFKKSQCMGQLRMDFKCCLVYPFGMNGKPEWLPDGLKRADRKATGLSSRRLDNS